MKVKRSDFNKKEASEAAKFNISEMTNASLIRMINKILDVGYSGYHDNDVLRKVNISTTDLYVPVRMAYSIRTVCSSVSPSGIPFSGLLLRNAFRYLPDNRCVILYH